MFEVFKTEGDWVFGVDLPNHAIVSLSSSGQTEAKSIAHARHYNKSPTDKDFLRRDPTDPVDEDTRGVFGERAFEELTGLRMDRTIRRTGDAGFDFQCNNEGRLLTLDVAVARMPGNLFLRADDPKRGKADIHVLATVSKDQKQVLFLGWQTRDVMLKQPIKVFDPILNYRNHYMPFSMLRGMWRLQWLLSSHPHDPLTGEPTRVWPLDPLTGELIRRRLP